MPYRNYYNSLGGFVEQRSPIRMDLTPFAQATQTIQNNMYKLAEQRGAIAAAINKLPMNSAEDAWKANYINNISAELDKYAQEGDYAGALNKATELANRAVFSPEVLSRVRANEEYEKEKQAVLNNKNLSQTTKDRWIEENPYSYTDTIDSNGNVVGGSSWNPNWRPYDSIDMTTLYNRVKQLASVEAGGGESAQFLDESGNLTNDISKGFYGMAVKRGSKWERLSADKLKRVFNNLFEQMPDAKQALLQQMDDRIWEYNKATDENKKAFIGSDIIKEDGTFRSPQEYLAHTVNPILSDMAYSHSFSSVDYGTAYATRAKAIKEQQGRMQLLALENDLNNTTFATPIQIDVRDRAGRTYATVQTALKDLSGLIPTFFNNPSSKEFIRNRNYDDLASYLEKNLDVANITGADKRKALQSINVLRNEGQLYNKLIAPLEPDQRDAAEFLFAKETGAPVPNAVDNKYSKLYATEFNKLFSYNKVPGKKNIIPIEKVGIQFQDDEQKRKLFNKLGLTDNTLSEHGLSIKNVNGRTTLVINKNTDMLASIADAFKEVDSFSSLGIKYFKTNRAKLLKFDDKGNIAKQYNASGYQNSGLSQLYQMGSSNHALNAATNISTVAFETNPDLLITQTLQVKPFDDYNTEMLNNIWINGGIEDGAYKEMKKEFQDNNAKAFGVAINNLNNFTVFAYDKNTGALVRAKIDDIKDIQSELLQAYDEGRYEISPSDAPTGKGYGTTVKVKGDAKKDIESKVYYIDGLLDGPAAKAVASNPRMIARHEYQTDRALGIHQADVVGNPILYDNPEIAISQYTGKKKLDDYYRILDRAKNANEEFTEVEAKAIATDILVNSGYNEEANPDAFKQARASLVIKLLNYYGD